MFASGMLVAIAIPALGQQLPASAFPDVPSNQYFSNAVQNLSQLGVLHGYSDGSFGPTNSVNRAEIAVMIERYDQTAVQPLRDQLKALQQKLGIGYCGNGTIEGSEQCDDGAKNGTPGDTCTISCQNSGGVMCDGHRVGDSYPSLDGCNSCTCTAQGQICTLRACQFDQKCTSDADCPDYASCSIQNCVGNTCTGVCKEKIVNACNPYICADGTSIPSCTADGHVINYFAAPCLTHGGEKSSISMSSASSCPAMQFACAQPPAGCKLVPETGADGCPIPCGKLVCPTTSSAAALCGNGICDQGEASYCPSQNCKPGTACPDYCTSGSCPTDCQ